MNNTQLTGMRMMAKKLNLPGPHYAVYDGQGRMIMFGLDESRAREFVHYYPGGKIELEKE